MLFPERMCRVDCLAAGESSDGLVRRLHEEGFAGVERLDDVCLSELSLSRSAVPARVTEVSGLAVRVRKAVDFLTPYGRGVGVVDELLDVRREGVYVRRFGFKELLEYAGDALTCADSSLLPLQSRQREVEMRFAEKKSFVDRYGAFRGAGLDSRLLGESDYLYSLAGVLQADSVDMLERGLWEALGGCFLLETSSRAGDSVVAVVSVLKEDLGVLEETLRKNRFTRMPVDFSGRLDELLAEADSALEGFPAERALLEDSFRSVCSEHLDRLLAVLELLELEKQRCEVFARFGATGHTSLLRIWVPLRQYGRLEALAREETHGRCHLSKTVSLEDAPVLLDNPRWLKPFESLTKMFSTPKYNHLDPTVLLAPTFVLFFGMMFSDFIYGLLTLLAALLVYRRYGPRSASARDVGVVLSYFGVSSMFFGLLTGSVLGDFLGKYVLGNALGSQSVALWLDPLYNGNMLVYIPLVFSIGLLHLLVGYASGAFDHLRRREYRTAFLGYFTMILAPAGILFYAMWHNVLGLAVAAVSLMLLLLNSGLMGFYIKVSGMLGSVVSYARLLALMAASSGIAMAVNFITQLSLSVPYLGVVLAPLVFIGGHLINILLNMLGSFVHSLRLHYVEFFGTFYEGGGTEFTPFMESRVYSKVIEEEVM